MPTLILSGGADLQCPPRQARILANGIPGSVLEFFPKTGHGVLAPGRPGADPEEWKRAVEVAASFLERAYATSTSA